MMIPLWAKILGPIAALAILIGGLMMWGNSKYRSGYDKGVSATDKKWEDAAAQLKKDAAESATRADDAAANRMVNFVEQHTADQEAVNEAQRNGTSPLDAIFN